MPRNPNIYGGGANTNKNGLAFEQTTSLNEALINAGYSVSQNQVFKDDYLIGLSVPKHDFYKKFLNPLEIYYEDYNSKQWLPDEAFVNLNNKTVYIIEKKFQCVAGSVDEKLPSCHFKRWEYEKLCYPIGYTVEFVYVLSDWFLDKKYDDILKYIVDMGCFYFYNKIPLDFLEL